MAAKKTGLGRGLDALLGGNLKAAAAPADLSKEGLTRLPITKLQPGKYQPRRDMKTEKLAELADSIRATFERRGKVLPVEIPAGFSAVFWNDPGRQAMWKSFWRKSVKLDPMLSLEQVVSFAAGFLLPPALAAAEGRSFNTAWKPGGSW